MVSFVGFVEFDVGVVFGYLSWYCDCVVFVGFGDDLGFFGVVFCVEYYGGYIVVY